MLPLQKYSLIPTLFLWCGKQLDYVDRFGSIKVGHVGFAVNQGSG